MTVFFAKALSLCIIGVCAFHPSTTLQATELEASDGAGGDLFGESVSVSGNQALVGAYLDDDNGSSSGSAYLFTDLDTAGANVTEDVKLTASDGASSDQFGVSVALDGDNFVIGAVFGDGRVIDSGTAYSGTISSVRRFFAEQIFSPFHRKATDYCTTRSWIASTRRFSSPERTSLMMTRESPGWAMPSFFR